MPTYSKEFMVNGKPVTRYYKSDRALDPKLASKILDVENAKAIKQTQAAAAPPANRANSIPWYQFAKKRAQELYDKNEVAKFKPIDPKHYPEGTKEAFFKNLPLATRVKENAKSWGIEERNYLPNNYAQVNVIDVGMGKKTGTGNAALYLTPNGKTVLIDTGLSDPLVQEAVRNTLRRENKQLDYVFLTHMDDDHMGGAAAIANDNPNTQFYYNGGLFDTYASQNLLGGLRKRTPQPLGMGQRLQLSPEAFLEVLNSMPMIYKKYKKLGVIGGQMTRDNDSIARLKPTDNEASGSTRYEYKGQSFTQLADIEKRGIANTIRQMAGRPTDILEISHHMSKNGFDPALYEAARPKAVVGSVGPNKYGMPDEQLLKYLRYKKVPTYTTWQGGETIFQLPGKGKPIKVMQRGK